MEVNVFSVLLLVSIVSVTHCAPSSKSSNCAAKYNTTEDYIQLAGFANLTKDQKRNLACTFGCMFKHAPIDSKGNKTLHQIILDIITKDEFSYKVPEYNAEALIQKMNTCVNVDNDECKYIECLDFYSQPWKAFLDSFIEYANSGMML